MAKTNPVTLKDVALLANVSVPTASKVLNGHGTVSEATRLRINAAAERLDFRHNALARSFATGRSLTVGVLAQKASGNFSVPVITGIITHLASRDVAVIVYDDGDVRAARPQNLRTLQARRADAVIIVGDGTDFPFPSVSHLFNVPVVHAFGVSDNPQDCCFLPDDVQAGRIATEHLVGFGRTRIAHITAMDTSAAVVARARGVVEALDDHGLKLVSGKPFYGDWGTPWGYRAVMKMKARLPKIDALVCGNDYIALGAARACEQLGIRIPEDIALVGYDNWSSYSGSPRPYLTTIDPKLRGIGELAAVACLSADAGDRQSGVEYLDCELVGGMSTGMVPMDSLGAVVGS